MRIAYLEDDLPQAEVMKDWLTEAEHRCRHYTSAKSFRKEARRESYDLLILDWELPESSGIEVLRWVREHEDWRIPILFVTHRDGERDIVRALSEGADDYMTKPVSREVTLARINALARRSGAVSRSDKKLQFGNFHMDTNTNSIMRDGESVDLTEKEYRLALMLFSNMGRLLSRNHILDAIWGAGPEVSTRTVDTHISRLRRKLVLVPENGWRLKAVYHHGYRLEKVVEDRNTATH